MFFDRINRINRIFRIGEDIMELFFILLFL